MKKVIISLCMLALFAAPILVSRATTLDEAIAQIRAQIDAIQNEINLYSQSLNAQQQGQTSSQTSNQTSVSSSSQTQTLNQAQSQTSAQSSSQTTTQTSAANLPLPPAGTITPPTDPGFYRYNGATFASFYPKYCQSGDTPMSVKESYDCEIDKYIAMADAANAKSGYDYVEMGPVSLAANRSVLEMTIPDVNDNYAGGDPYLFGTVKSVDDASHFTLSVLLSSALKVTDGANGISSLSGKYDNTDQTLAKPAFLETPPVGAAVVIFVKQNDPPFSIKRIEYIDGSYRIELVGTTQDVNVANRTVTVKVSTLQEFKDKYQADAGQILRGGSPEAIQNANNVPIYQYGQSPFSYLFGKTLSFYVPSSVTFGSNTWGGIRGPTSGKSPRTLNDISTGVSVGVVGYRVFGDTLVLTKLRICPEYFPDCNDLH